MRIRSLVSLMVAGSFAVLATTGLLIFFGFSSKMVDTIHSVFGILFMFFAMLHIFNNFRELKSYSKSQKKNA